MNPPVIYVVSIRDHPEFPVDTMIGETPASVANVYVRGYAVPDDCLDNLRVYDCYTATMYALLPKDAN